MKESSLLRSPEFVSVVVCVSYLNELHLKTKLSGLIEVLDRKYDDYEVLIIADDPLRFNRMVIQDLLEQVPSLRYIDSACEISEGEAVELGLKLSIGDYVVYLQPGQDDINVVHPVVEQAKSQGKVVVGVNTAARETIPYRLCRPLFRLFEGFIGYHLPRRATALRCFSRSQVNAYTGMLSSPDQVFLKIDQIADGHSVFEYRSVSSSPKRLLPKLWEASSHFVNNSIRPLRFASILGVLGSFFAFVFACYSFVSHFITNNVVSGWSSLVVIVSFLFFILFLILVLIGEYMARMLNEFKRRDRSIGLKEFHSNVMLSEQRINVVDDSGFGNKGQIK